MKDKDRQALIREANRLLRQYGFFSDKDLRQLAFERRIILTPPNGKIRPRKFQNH